MKELKKQVYKNIPKHSAYRSGIVVQKYKASFKKKYGNKIHIREIIQKRKGLRRWFDEKMGKSTRRSRI